MLWCFRVGSRAFLSCVLVGILCLGCGEKQVDLTTPESTIRTYVRAYNVGNERALRMCGIAGDLKDAFKRPVLDEYGKQTEIAVDGIEYEVVKSIPGTSTVTRMFTTRTVTLVIHFTSKYERDYEKTVRVGLQCRRTVYDEEDTWTIL